MEKFLTKCSLKPYQKRDSDTAIFLWLPLGDSFEQPCDVFLEKLSSFQIVILVKIYCVSVQI